MMSNVVKIKTNVFKIKSSVLLLFDLGIAKNLAEMMSPEMLTEAGLTRIIGSGACLSRNPVLRAEVQEIYQMPVEFTNEGSACIGAALAAIDVHYQKKS